MGAAKTGYLSGFGPAVASCLGIHEMGNGVMAGKKGRRQRRREEKKRKKESNRRTIAAEASLGKGTGRFGREPGMAGKEGRKTMGKSEDMKGASGGRRQRCRLKEAMKHSG